MDAIFRALPGVLNAIENSEEARRAFVFAAWKRIAGGHVAERTACVAFEEKRLAVAVADKVWQRNLESLSSQLLFRLNDVLGGSFVIFIEYRIDPTVIAEVRDDRNRTESEGKALESLPPDIAIAAGAISDAELRRKFMLAAANCLTRKHGR